MKRLPALLPPAALLAFLLLAPRPDFPARAADRRPDRARLTIATFNARFLFDGRPPEGQGDFPWKDDPAAARRHLQEIAAIVRRVDADLLHISEVEDHETLERLRLEVGDPTYAAYLVPGRDAFTRQNVGLLSRVDPDGPLLRTDESWPAPGGGERQSVSKNYAAHLGIDDLPLAVIGVHLLAFPDDPERAGPRQAQAEVMRRLAAREGTARGRLLVVLGDFNDYDREIGDVAGNMPITRVLETVRAADGAGAAHDLVNAALWLPPLERFTAFFDRNANGIDDGYSERALTDHVLLSRSLAAAVTRAETFTGHEPTGPSDHFPLKVTLDLGLLDLFVRGDADGNRAIDDADALAILFHAAGEAPLPCPDAGDADDDGRIVITDAVFLLNRLHLLGPPPPPPGPRLPGPDETADSLPCRPRR
jgi:endonuclease/exonuclease/phosphatase family metal-dependent hydrolase